MYTIKIFFVKTTQRELQLHVNIRLANRGFHVHMTLREMKLSLNQLAQEVPCVMRLHLNITRIQSDSHRKSSFEMPSNE